MPKNLRAVARPVVVTKLKFSKPDRMSMQFPAERSIIYIPLLRNIERCINDFDQIPEGRKDTLMDLSRFVEKKISAGKNAELIFICTHNSRRSHMAQLWAQAAAAYYNIPAVHAYSGGTEVTAVNSSAIKALEELGFRIRPTTKNENPVYEIRFSNDLPPLRGFSKKYDDPENPKRGFGAIMTCSHADQNCPFVEGAEKRMTISFDDPKDFDGTPEESKMYKERAYQIGREILYSFSQIRIPSSK